MIEKSIKQGESLRIGFSFNPEYDESRINDLLMYIDGVLIGRKSAGTISKNIYWNVSLSGDATFNLHGHRDLILIMEDSRFGLRKFVVASLLFDRLADEFHANIKNQGYNLILNLEIDETILTSDVLLLEAIKGDKGDPGGGAMIGGGFKDQVLTKLSDTNLDAGWKTPLQLGELASNAYYGDKGLIAYTHSQTLHAPSDAEKNVNADWNSTSGASLILNKPTIPSIDGLATETFVVNSLSVKVDKVDGKSLVLDTEIAKIHLPHSDDQDLSGLMLTSEYVGLNATKWTRYSEIAFNANHADEATKAITDANGFRIDITYATKYENSLKEDIINKGANNGYAPLDSGGKIPLQNLPSTLLKYIGTWNAGTNTPYLITPDLTKIGNVYTVSSIGTQFGISFGLGDWLIYNALGIPEKADNSDDVLSVNGQTGIVVITKSDISLGNVDNTSDAAKPISILTQNALDLLVPISTFNLTLSYKEDKSNKVTSFNLPTDVQYPSAKLVSDQLSLKVDKVAGKSLLLDTEITRLAEVYNQTLSGLGGVPNTRTINGHQLNSDFNITPSDLSLVIGTNVLAYRTFGTAANKNTGDFEVPLTFSTGLSRVGNVITNTITQYTDTLADARVVVGITGKQNTLVSGTNIKTVGGNSLLGSGDISFPDSYILPTASSTILGGVKIGSGVSIASGVISVSTNYQSPLVSGTSIKTINSTSLLGSGDIAITPTTLGLVIGTNVLAYRTFGTAANNNTEDFETPLTFGVGLLRTANSIACTISQYTDALARSAQNISSSIQTGLLTNTDWNIFNNKQTAITIGNLTSTTPGVSITNGIGAIIGSGVTLNISAAGPSSNGLLSSNDWNSFNSKVSFPGYSLLTNNYIPFKNSNGLSDSPISYSFGALTFESANIFNGEIYSRNKIHTEGSIQSDVNIISPTFTVRNGLSSQFLKADGSLDSNTYLTGITKTQIESVLTGLIATHTHSYSTFSGAYSDLTGKPTLFSGSYADLSNKPALFSGSYTDLTNKPIIPNAQVQSDWTATVGLEVILNKPILFSGLYSDLSGKPIIPTVGILNTLNTTSQTVNNSESLSGIVQLHKVAKTGIYLDLLERPTQLSQFINNLGNYGDWKSNINYVDITVTRNSNDFNSVREAMESITDASATKIYRLHIPAGRWYECDIYGKKYVEFIGEGIDKTILYNDGTSTKLTPANYSYIPSSYAGVPLNTVPYGYRHVIFSIDDIVASNITFEQTSCKYAAHIDNPGPAMLSFINCKFKTVTTGGNPIGMGLHSGQNITFTNCIFQAIEGYPYGFFVHTNSNQYAGVTLTIQNSKFENCTYGWYQDLASNWNDYINIINCTSNGCGELEFNGPDSWVNPATGITITDPTQIPYFVRLNLSGTKVQNLKSLGANWVDVQPTSRPKFLDYTITDYATKATIPGIVIGDLIGGYHKKVLSYTKYNGTTPFIGVAITSTDSNGFVYVAEKGKIIKVPISGTSAIYVNINKTTNLLEFSTKRDFNTVGIMLNYMSSNIYEVEIIENLPVYDGTLTSLTTNSITPISSFTTSTNIANSYDNASGINIELGSRCYSANLGRQAKNVVVGFASDNVDLGWVNKKVTLGTFSDLVTIGGHYTNAQEISIYRGGTGTDVSTFFPVFKALTTGTNIYDNLSNLVFTAVNNIGNFTSVPTISGVSLDTKYITSSQSIPQTVGSSGARLGKLWGSEIDVSGTGLFGNGVTVNAWMANVQLILGRTGSAIGRVGLGSNVDNYLMVYDVDNFSNPFAISRSGIANFSSMPTVAGTSLNSTFQSASSAINTGNISVQNVQTAKFLDFSDKRGDVDTPNSYTTPSLRTEFKANGTNGLNDGGSNNGVITYRKYGSDGDWSGGNASQLGFTDAGNMWLRTGAGSSWGGWNKVLHTGNFTPANYIQNNPSNVQNGTVWVDGIGRFTGGGYNTEIQGLSSDTTPWIAHNSPAYGWGLFDGSTGDFILQAKNGTTTWNNFLRVSRNNGAATFASTVQTTGITPTNLTTGYIPYKSGGVLVDSPIATANGNVGIGYSSGAEITNNKLAVNGSAYFNGTVTASNFILSSDRNLKTNIIPISKDYSNIEFKEYEFKNKLGEKRFGVVAQDLLESGNEEFVTGNKEDGYAVKYIDLLIAEVSSLKNRLKNMEDKYGCS